MTFCNQVKLNRNDVKKKSLVPCSRIIWKKLKQIRSDPIDWGRKSIWLILGQSKSDDHTCRWWLLVARACNLNVYNPTSWVDRLSAAQTQKIIWLRFYKPGGSVFILSKIQQVFVKNKSKFEQRLFQFNKFTLDVQWASSGVKFSFQIVNFVIQFSKRNDNQKPN